MRIAASALFFAMIYVIGVMVVRPWIYLPDCGNVPFTLLFTGFALVHAAATLGWRRAATFFALAAAISWGFEEAGVATGWIFGPYHYSHMLGAELGYVPVLIPLAWFMMIYPSWCVARVLLPAPSATHRRLPFLAAQSLMAAMVVTAWDVVMDPGMARGGNWIWEKGGPYFGVPLQNYAGWLLTTFTIYLIAGLVLATPRGQSFVPGIHFHGRVHPRLDAWFAALPVLLYAWFALRYLTNEREGAFHVIALFSMGFPAMLAVLRLAFPAGQQPGSVRSDPGENQAATGVFRDGPLTTED
ncbi:MULTISPECIES: carotenoid biosynthesis protein [Acidobacterium]|uniref:Putative membrane protein n=1 Tax=Acidobacterium capsulatum (strain ATCC 51196 / DSM 11244 / BCRC 80197 / JCM 7670 / NBRC 15755 / NCIMB 13165 / 161) TaxID=240015 RepID=C1FA51_ACIC5|nr:MULTISPECIES: carotenoid biosynthesis protein [Acidobacterium]ACO33259.1 putative membrane protein [Acidobacterium capsulatum ATCC 51196]HCT62286.1 carotenoid biosynthesis protein [Acidobacterium sp.]